MGRQIINSITCCNCNTQFDVTTEDIEWEHNSDIGETEENSSIHDFKVSQTVECPHCGKKNKILMHAKGKTADQLDSIEVISMEIDI